MVRINMNPNLEHELVTLRRELARQHLAQLAQREALARLQRTLPARPAHRWGPLRRRFVAAPFLALVLALVPLAIFAAEPFADLNPGGVHNGNIAAVAAVGITKGCDADALRYCPNDPVNREQMASFLARTAGLGGNPPVANALTSVSAQTAAQATNASALDGYQANGLVRVGKGDTTLSLLLTASKQVYTSLTLIAPSPGFVLVNGAVDFRRGGSLTCPCNGVAELYHVQANASSRPHGATLINLHGARGAVALTYVFPVSAGSQTFQVRVLKINDQDIISNGDTYAEYGEITALFVPFDGTGSAP